jgi:hypothetical protein
MTRKLFGSAFDGGFVNIQDVSTTETTILAYSDLQDWLSARFPDQDILVPNLGSQVGLPAVPPDGSIPPLTSQNAAGLPFIELDGSSAALLTTQQGIPASHTVYAIVRPDVVNATQVFVGSAVSTGFRFLLGLISSSAARYDHGTGGSDSVAGPTLTAGTQYIAWASYNASTNAATIGVSKRAGNNIATFTNDLDASSITCIGGTTDNYRGNMGVAEVLIFNTVHDSTKRSTIMNYLSALSGIAIVD